MEESPVAQSPASPESTSAASAIPLQPVRCLTHERSASCLTSRDFGHGHRKCDSHEDYLDVLSQTTEHALRGFIYIATQAPRSVRLSEVADAVNAPPQYLAKILSQLVRAGHLVSTRGRSGGYALAPQREPVTLGSVAAVFETPQPQRCLLGSGACGSNPDCPVHQRWAPIASSMSSFLARTTVAELVASRPTPPR